MAQGEEKWLKSHLMDLARQAETYSIPMYSDFLDTAQQELLYDLEKHVSVRVEYNGGYEGAERRMASFCPPFFYEEQTTFPICCLEICPRGAQFVRKPPQHRDYLGSILGCGIDRKKTGDILVREEGALIFVCEEMAVFLMENLREVGHVPVDVQRYDGSLEDVIPHGKELVISVASLRLDAVLSRGFGMGRGDAADLIRAGRVQIDHHLCGKTDQVVGEEALLTVRGKGRLKLKGMTGTSKSGRIQVRAERFG